MPYSTAWDNKILEHSVGKTTMAFPSPAFVGLAFTASTKAAAGTEPSTADGYARKQITWGTAASSVLSNSAVVTFNQATGDWGGAGGQNLTNAVIFDAASAGNYIGFINLSVAKKVLSGEIGRFEIGDLSLALT